MWLKTQVIQAEGTEEDNFNVNVTINKADVNLIRYNAKSGSLYVGRLNDKN